MEECEIDRLRRNWDEKAQEWDNLLGSDGCNMRRFVSDPVLINYLGDVAGKVVIDAGCGNGYFSEKLSRLGAEVIGTDLAPAMIELAQKRAQKLQLSVDYRVDSCETLQSFADRSADIIVANYVLMDTPNLELACRAFYRVLRPGGILTCVFLHPERTELSEHEMYFDEFKKQIDLPGVTTPSFIYHRPLNSYWKAFRSCGFVVEDFDEPVAQDPSAEGFKEAWLPTYRKCADLVSFKLRKPS